MRSRSRTSHSRPCSAAIWRARSASTVGVRRLAGSLTRSRAKFCDSATMRPCAQGLLQGRRRLGDHHGEAVHGLLLVLVLGLVAVRLVVAENGALDGGRDVLRRGESGVQRQSDAARALGLQQPQGRARQPSAVRPRRSFAALPPPIDQQLAAFRPGGSVQERGLERLSLELARLVEILDPSDRQARAQALGLPSSFSKATTTRASASIWSRGSS